jgi:hypothetical protein
MDCWMHVGGSMLVDACWWFDIAGSSPIRLGKREGHLVTGEVLSWSKLRVKMCQGPEVGIECWYGAKFGSLCEASKV